MITIEIPLEPYAQERPRFARLGPITKTYDGPKSKAWKAAARIYMKAAIMHLKGKEARIPLFEKGAVLGVQLYFFFRLPKNDRRLGNPPAPKWHTGRMDFDNLAKCVCDAGNGIIWDDDRQIAHAEIFKIRVGQDDVRKWGVVLNVRDLRGTKVPVGGS